MKTCSKTATRTTKRRRRWEGREIAPEGETARFPAASLANGRARGQRCPGRAGGGRPHWPAAERWQRRELRCECSPGVHLRFKGDCVTPSGVLCFGPGRRKGWGGGAREEVLGNSPRQNICQTAQTPTSKNLVGVREPVATEGAQPCLPPAASPGRRGARQIRSVLNFTVH